MQMAAIKQRLHQHRHAAGLPHVFSDETPAGFEIGEIGRAFEDRSHIEEIEFDAGLVGHGG